MRRKLEDAVQQRFAALAKANAVRTARRSSETPDAEICGENPQKRTKAAMPTAEQIAKSAGKAIRAKCIDCCCYQTKEVKLCAATTCPLWAWRFGKRPKKEETK